MAIVIESSGPEVHVLRSPSRLERTLVVAFVVATLGGLSWLCVAALAEAYGERVRHPGLWPSRPITSLLLVLVGAAGFGAVLRSGLARYVWHLVTRQPTAWFWRALTIRPGGEVCVHDSHGRPGRFMRYPMATSDRAMGFGRITFMDEDGIAELFLGERDQQELFALLDREGMGPRPAEPVDPNVTVVAPAAIATKWLPLIYVGAAVVMWAASFESEPYSRDRGALQSRAVALILLGGALQLAELLFRMRMRWLAREWRVEPGVVRMSWSGRFERSVELGALGLAQSWRGHQVLGVGGGGRTVLFTSPNARRVEGVARWIAERAQVPLNNDTKPQ